MQDPNQADTTVEVVQKAQRGQKLAFTIKGTGAINESSPQVAAGASQGQGMSNRPGGGLGNPIDTPDPLQQYRWYILGGFALVLAAGGWYVTMRKPSAACAPSGTAAKASAPRAAAVAVQAGPGAQAAQAPGNSSGAKSSMILD